MNTYVGKTCPYCKTVITEYDSVIVCPVCGIPHHKGCWNENRGCTTFGCSAQNYPVPTAAPAPAAVCTTCGAPFGDNHAFCPQCGRPRPAAVPRKKLCPKCASPLDDNQIFCVNCGHKVDVVVDTNVNAAINQFNAGAAQKKKKNIVLPIVISAVVVVAIAIGLFVFSAMSAKKAEQVRKDYINDVEEYMDLTLTAGVNLEDIADTILLYWYEHIWEDKHGSDINDAVYYAMVDMSSEIDDAADYDSELSSLYSQIKKVPDGLADEDEDDIEEICDAVKDMHTAYSKLYTLATDPTGSYNSYSEDVSDAIDDFLYYYNALEDLVE